MTQNIVDYGFFRVMPFLLGTALLGACGLMEQKEPPKADLARAHKAMELRMETRDENYKRAIEDLSRMFRETVEAAGRLQGRIVQLEARLDRVDERLAGRAAPPRMVPSQPSTFRPTSYQPGRSPAITPMAIPSAPTARAERFAEISSILKDPTFSQLGAIKKELAAMPAEATAFLMNEIKRAPADIKLAKRAEEIIASFPPVEVRAPLARALQDPQLRVMAAWIVNDMASPAYAEVLRDFTTDPDPDFQLAIGAALVSCRDKAGVPFLIRGLSSELMANRIVAIQNLKRINRGESYGFNWQSNAAQNAEAIKQWEGWWAVFKEYDLLD